jgi:5-methylcytosine-specific restriction endonuclease McrA
MRKTTKCLECNEFHPTNGVACTEKRNAYQKEYRHRLGISKNYCPQKGKPVGKRLKTERNPIVRGTRTYSSEWHILRKEIYKRDGWSCRECGIKCGDKKQNHNIIQCHHIDYDTMNNNFNNLITLCTGCHAKTRYNRNDWIEYYKLNAKEMMI